MREFNQILLDGGDLEDCQAYEAMGNLVNEETPEAQKAAFLGLLARKRLGLGELNGFRRALEERAVRPRFAGDGFIDVCGTGGDGRNTFNISTLTAFVVAGAGVKVAKHGNYAAGSKCGSSNVLEAIGVKLSGDQDHLERQLERSGVVMLHAPYFQPALKSLGPLRKQLGFRTVFNVLGPLLNPVRPEFQMIGVANPELLRLYHYHLQSRGQRYALVRSADGCDELSLTSEADVVTREAWERWTPEQLGFTRLSISDLDGGSSIEQFAATFIAVLEDRAPEAHKSIVTANAAQALKLASGESYDACRERVKESLESGKAMARLKALVACA